MEWRWGITDITYITYFGQLRGRRTSGPVSKMDADRYRPPSRQPLESSPLIGIEDIKGASPDWERIESDYRAGLLSLRAIAAKDGHVTEGAIRKKARKLEWARDLTARIHAKAEELVRKEMVRSVGPQYATASETTEAAIVQDNAQILAHVELTQRRDISKARQIVVALFAELEAVTGERFTSELLQYLPNAGGEDNAANRARGALSKATSLPARSAAVKALADALRTLVTLEREAWGLGLTDNRAPPTPPARIIDSSKLTGDEREQLRQMILKVSAEQNASEGE